MVFLKVTVTIPGVLRQFTHSNSEVDLEALTVEDVISNLDSMFPGLKALLLDEGKQVRRYVNIYVNNDEIRSKNGLMTPLRDGDRVQIIPAVAGG